MADADRIAFGLLLSGQTNSGTHGGALEIGVLFGKSAIEIGGGLRPGEALAVCDPFDGRYQHDELGRERGAPIPSRQDFENRFAEAVPDIRCAVFEMSSAALTPAMLNDLSPLRFVHVDGAHDFRSVDGDLRLVADLSLSDRAWVVVDDYCRFHLPGAAAAIWSFLMGPSALRIVFATRDKLYLAPAGLDRSVPEEVRGAFRQMALRSQTHRAGDQAWERFHDDPDFY